MKILVVDDEVLLVKGIKFNLESEGYTVECCYDGESAVNMARENNYDLIILDLMMPKKDGLQACLELKARVRALLRRASLAVPQSEPRVLRRGHITIDPERRSASRGDTPVELTMKEFDLIEFLMRNPGRVYSRENLLNLVWGYDYQGDTRTVDVHIRRLREKLEINPAQPEYIITKWGVGYYFAD